MRFLLAAQVRLTLRFEAQCDVCLLIFDERFERKIIHVPFLWVTENEQNQSRMCGRGVGSGLSPSDSLESQSYDFDEIAHIRPIYGVQRLRKASLKPKKVFAKIEKVQNWPFSVILD